MSIEQVLHRLRRSRIGRAAGVGVDREARRVEFRRVNRGRQRRLGRRHQFGMERTGYRQQAGAQSFGAELQHRLFDLVLGPRNHRLLGCVVIGDAHTIKAQHQRSNALARALHRRHAARLRGLGCSRHRATAGCGQTQEIGWIEGTCSHQRRVLAVAVPCGRHRFDAQAFSQAQIAQRQGTDGRLRHACIGQCGVLNRFRLCIETGVRQHQRGQRTTEFLCQHDVSEFQRLAHFRQVQCGLATHVQVLRPLPREQEGHCRRCCRHVLVELDARRQRLGTTLEVGHRGGQILRQRFQITRDHC